MRACSESKFLNPTHKQKIFDILENILIAINNLTRNYPKQIKNSQNDGVNSVKEIPSGFTACKKIINQMLIFDVSAMFLNVICLECLSLKSRTIYVNIFIFILIKNFFKLLNRIIEKIYEKKNFQIPDIVQTFLTALENTIDKNEKMNYAFHLTKILLYAVPETYMV